MNNSHFVHYEVCLPGYGGKIQGLRSCAFLSQDQASELHTGGVTSMEFPGGPMGLDLMNVGHRELPVCV